MSDPVGGPQSPAEVFEQIGASIPDEDPTPVAGSEGAAPAQEAAPELPAAPEAQPRDDAGRYAIKKDAPAPADAAVVPPTAAAPEPPVTVPSPETPVPGIDLSKYPAYEYRVNGQNVPFKGAIRGSDGVLFGKDSLPQLERLLSEAHQAHTAQSTMGRRVGELQAQVRAAQEEKNAVLGKLSEIMADPAKFDQWALDTQGNWEKLLLQAQLKMATDERDSRATQYQEVVSEQEVQALIPQLHSATDHAIRELVAQPEFTDLGLDAEWQRDFKQRMLETHFDRLFTEATEQDVNAGIAQQVGQTVFHPEPILAEMRYQAGFVRKELARNKALAEAQARNQRGLQSPASIPTPGAKPTGSPAAKPKPALKPGMSKGEVDKLVFDTMIDD